MKRAGGTSWPRRESSTVDPYSRRPPTAFRFTPLSSLISGNALQTSVEETLTRQPNPELPFAPRGVNRNLLPTGEEINNKLHQRDYFNPLS